MYPLFYMTLAQATGSELSWKPLSDSHPWWDVPLRYKLIKKFISSSPTWDPGCQVAATTTLPNWRVWKLGSCRTHQSEDIFNLIGGLVHWCHQAFKGKNPPTTTSTKKYGWQELWIEIVPVPSFPLPVWGSLAVAFFVTARILIVLWFANTVCLKSGHVSTGRVEEMQAEWPCSVFVVLFLSRLVRSRLVPIGLEGCSFSEITVRLIDRINQTYSPLMDPREMTMLTIWNMRIKVRAAKVAERRKKLRWPVWTKESRFFIPYKCMW